MKSNQKLKGKQEKMNSYLNILKLKVSNYYVPYSLP